MRKKIDFCPSPIRLADCSGFGQLRGQPFYCEAKPNVVAGDVSGLRHRQAFFAIKASHHQSVGSHVASHSLSRSCFVVSGRSFEVFDLRARIHLSTIIWINQSSRSDLWYSRISKSQRFCVENVEYRASW